MPSGAVRAAHSDADVVCHAATDAMLGAAALGDIGRHFPDTDPEWKGASGLDLLRRAAAMVRDAGFEIVNLDVAVILEAPEDLAVHRAHAHRDGGRDGLAIAGGSA